MVPETISSLKQLALLQLSFNQLKQLPVQTFQLENLAVLSISNNPLTQLPDFRGLQNLQVVDVSQCKLSAVPSGLESCRRLRKLDLHTNMIAGLVPSRWSSLLELEEVDLSQNLFQGVDGVVHWPAVTRLDWKQNRLRDGALALALPKCRELSLGFNSLQSLPEEMDRFWPELRILDLRDNKLSLLPLAITRMTTLERLDLCNNDLSKLPPELGLLPLHSLLLSGNPLRGFPRDTGTQAILKWLKSRITSTPGSAESAPPPPRFPSEVTAAQAAADGPLPTSFGSVVSLVGKNLMDLPNFPDTAAIDDLDMSKNRIPHVRFASTGWAKNLRLLKLAQNCITELPATLASDFPQLDTLDLTANRISQIHIQFPVRLSVLLLSSNKISHVATEGLPMSLKTLDLSNNAIDKVPPELGLLAELTVLKLEGNVFRAPRQAILSKGSVAVLEWIRMQLK